MKRAFLSPFKVEFSPKNKLLEKHIGFIFLFNKLLVILYPLGTVFNVFWQEKYPDEFI